MKGLVEFIQEQLEHVICQDAAGNWRIKGHPGKGTNTDKLGYWKAKYKSKKDAEDFIKRRTYVWEGEKGMDVRR